MINLGEGAVMDPVNNLTSVFQAHTLTLTSRATSPASVDKPDVTVKLLNLFGEHLSIVSWVESQECFSKTSRERSLWLGDTNLSARDLGRITSNEVVHGLFGGELGNWGKDSESVTCEEDNVLWMSSDAWNLSVCHELDRVAEACVLGVACVVEVYLACVWVHDNVLENGAETDCLVDIRLLHMQGRLGVMA